MSAMFRLDYQRHTRQMHARRSKRQVRPHGKCTPKNAPRKIYRSKNS